MYSDDNFNIRWDSVFFIKKDLNKLNVLSKINNYQLSKIAFVTDGEHGSPIWDENSGIKYITADFIKPNEILDAPMKTISLKQDEKNARCRLLKNDVLIYSVGAYAGYACCAEPHLFPANIPRSVALIRLNNNNFTSGFVSVFLNCNYGIFQSKRLCAGNAQPVLAIENVSSLIVPQLNIEFQNMIDNIYWEAYKNRQNSKSAYRAAEKILLSALNLENFTPTTENKSVKTFAETFASGRLDAEYYQKKYDEIEERIKGIDHIYAKECIAENNKNYTPLKNEKYTYIELANIENNGGIDDDCIITKGGELPTRARRQVKTDDVIISSVEGSIDKCAIISSKYNKALCSTGFYVMRSSKINSETLLLLFKSNPIQTLMKRGCNGTILMAISREELERIPIPLPAKNIQTKISAKVKESFALREQSKTLLKAAVKAVETAIEDGEEKAMEYLRENH